MPTALRSTPIAPLAAAAFLALALWTLAPLVVGREARAPELLMAGAGIAVALEWLRRRLLRRERQYLESLRDSALW